ncbi:MAG TPA: hypothetical protein VNZ22_21565, partial [Bacillota bacterium]|nr:hypothetical protein [Bacillota bacterium]
NMKQNVLRWMLAAVVAVLGNLAAQPGIAAETEAPRAPVVMLKLDDLVRQKGKDATVPVRWQKLVDFLEAEKIKASLGILTESLEGECPAYCDWIKTHVAKGYIELWDHGHYQRGLPETMKTNGRTAEYLGGSAADQAVLFEKSLALVKEKTGLELAAFGPHSTAIDATTYTALENIPQIKAVWFYGPPKGVKTSKVVIQRFMELEKPLFVPNPEQVKKSFLEQAARLPYIAVQGHPNQWDDARFESFKQAVLYLREQGCRFVTISDYLAQRPVH